MDGMRARVLVVDDSHDSADSLAMILSASGHEVRAVYDGEDAIEAAETFRPAIILMDVGMPKLNGYEATRRIRQSSRPSIPIIALTAHAMSGQRQRYLDAGMDDFLSKPVDMEQLAAVLAKWCSGPDPLR